MEFKIERYLGDEEEEQVTTTDKQTDLFQARIEERRKKRQLQDNTGPPEQCSDDRDEKPKKKKKKKKKDLVDEDKDMEPNTGEDIVDTSKKEVCDNIENEINDEKNSSITEDTPKKKKKKKKKSLTSQSNNTEDEGDHKETNITEKVNQDTVKDITEEVNQDIVKDSEAKNLSKDGVLNGVADGNDNDAEKEIENQDNNSNMDTGDTTLNGDTEMQNTDAADTEMQNTETAVQENNVQSENYFPILGKQHKVKKTIVKRSLPRWLNEPILMSADINSSKVAIKEVDFLSEKLLKNLAANDIEYLFPVQHSVVHKVMSQNKTIVSKYPPRDVCVQAPTGSGKTLAYVLPIVDVLSKYIVRQLYCLVVVPSKDLAVQVHKVFEAYVKGTHLKVALASGLKTFAKEQENLVTKGSYSKVDIVVSTPGRLVDHLKQTPGFNLNYLRFLVVDEADRLLGQDYSSWLDEVKSSVHSPDRYDLNRPKVFPINVSTFLGCQMPFQKLLFSATLTQNPEKLASLELFHPILFTSKQESNKQIEENDDNKNITVGDGERFIIPENLEENMVVVEADQKPLVLVCLMLHMNWKGVLCFTNSIAATHRLCLLLQSFQGFTVAEFSSSLSETQRKGIIRDFNSGKVDLLISSDAMARGMDINAVRLVVNYDTAANAKTYVHRVGRTARAGKEGSAITILHSKEVYHFKLMMKKLSGKVIPKLNVPKDALKSYQEQYEKALSSLQERISMENRNNGGKFTKRT